MLKPPIPVSALLLPLGGPTASVSCLGLASFEVGPNQSQITWINGSDPTTWDIIGHGSI